MKKLFLSLLLVAGFALASNAQVLNAPRLTAMTKPNPAQPINVAACSVTDIGNDQLEIDFEIDGIGFWSFYVEATTDTTPNTCVVDWTRSGGQPTLCSIVVRKSTYIGCFWSCVNVHGLPPIFPPYK